jgi:cytochrome P450
MVTWCLDRVITAGRCDIVDDIANPLPALVTLDLMGLPLENSARYARALHGAAYREKGSARELAWLLGDLRQEIERRHGAGGAGGAVLTPIDAMLAAEVDGEPLSVDLVVELVYMLVTGGIDTSTALIAHAIRHLSAHPDAAARLRANPDLIRGAVDEMLRYFSPGTGIARTAVRDTMVGGICIQAGERVFVGAGAANADPAVFEDPDTLDLGRDAARLPRQLPGLAGDGDPAQRGADPDTGPAGRRIGRPTIRHHPDGGRVQGHARDLHARSRDRPVPGWRGPAGPRPTGPVRNCGLVDSINRC